MGISSNIAFKCAVSVLLSPRFDSARHKIRSPNSFEVKTEELIPKELENSLADIIRVMISSDTINSFIQVLSEPIIKELLEEQERQLPKFPKLPTQRPLSLLLPQRLSPLHQDQ